MKQSEVTSISLIVASLEYKKTVKYDPTGDGYFSKGIQRLLQDYNANPNIIKKIKLTHHSIDGFTTRLSVRVSRDQRSQLRTIGNGSVTTGVRLLINSVLGDV